MADITKQAYLFAQSQLERANQELRETHRMAEVAADRVVSAQEVFNLVASRYNPCKSCDGRGKIREWLAQDESKVVLCTDCGGSGRAK